MSKLTVIILAKNEEQNIVDCINSAKFADEVLIIDDFSTDKTVQVAESMGARVVQHALENNYALPAFNFTNLEGIKAIIEAAEELNSPVIIQVTEGAINYAGFEYLRDLGLAAEVSGESDSVNNDPKKKKERMFWLDDGRQVYCENHIKLPDGYRLHFYADAVNKRVYVAYLGGAFPFTCW